MSELPITFNDIFKLKDFYAQKSLLDSQIRTLEHFPLCEDRTKILGIKQCIDQAVLNFDEQISNPTYRKLFVLVVLYIYQPNVLAGKKSSKWLRHYIAIALGISHWRVTGITTCLLEEYATNFIFRQLVIRILPIVWEKFNPQFQHG